MVFRKRVEAVALVAAVVASVVDAAAVQLLAMLLWWEVSTAVRQGVDSDSGVLSADTTLVE